MSLIQELIRYMADAGDFHRAIHAEPAEGTHALVYADWLQEQGKPAHAQVLRDHVQQAGTGGAPVAQHTIHTSVVYGMEPHSSAVSMFKGQAGGWRLNLQQLSGHPDSSVHWQTAPMTKIAALDLYTRLVKEGAEDGISHPESFDFNGPDGDIPEDNNPNLSYKLRYSADHSDFHRAIHEQPEEGTNALVYADWLEENGKPAQAEVIRHHVAHSGTGGEQHNLQMPFHDDPHVSVNSEGRPALNTMSLIHPQFSSHNELWDALFEDRRPVANRYRVSLDQISPDVRRSITWQTGPLEWSVAHDLHKRLIAEGANPPHPQLHEVDETPNGDVLPVRLSAEGAVKYAGVPQHDLHPDYAPTGVAPRIGHLLNQIAAEPTDAGLLAEGIIRTGDHSLLKILADKLDDDGHPLKDALDWRHAERGMKVDREVQAILKSRRIGRPSYHSVTIERVPLTPFHIVNDWRNGNTRPPISKRAMLKEVRKVVPDASHTDVVHSLLRTMDHTWIGAAPNFDTDAHSVSGVAGWVKETLNSYAAQLGAKSGDAHTYPDTRPPNKRYTLQSLKVRYASFKSPAGGMVVKESPLAVTGSWAPGGSFTRDLTQLNQPIPYRKGGKVTLAELRRRWKRVRRVVVTSGPDTTDADDAGADA